MRKMTTLRFILEGGERSLRFEGVGGGVEVCMWF